MSRCFSTKFAHHKYPSHCAAIVFNGPHNGFTFKQVESPKIIDSTDVIVRMDKTTICGTDLHILNGNVFTCKPDTILGHEGIGHVIQTGDNVNKFKIGDKLLISCITSCGHCNHCLNGYYGLCQSGGGWNLGNTMNGCQTEYVRVPFADYSCHKLSDKDDETATLVSEIDIDDAKYCMLSDILPTGFETGLIDGKAEYGKTKSIAIVGCGPVGLATMTSAVAMIKPERLFAIDINENRLTHAKNIGATDLMHNGHGTAVNDILQLTDHVGVDLVIECIGTPTGWYIAQDIVRSGGNIAILGVHGKPVELNLERMWYKNFSLTAGIVSTHSIQQLKQKIDSQELNAERLISHQFKMSEMDQAYYTFQNANETGALKVIIVNDLSPSVQELTTNF